MSYLKRLKSVLTSGVVPNYEEMDQNLTSPELEQSMAKLEIINADSVWYELDLDIARKLFQVDLKMGNNILVTLSYLKRIAYANDREVA